MISVTCHVTCHAHLFAFSGRGFVRVSAIVLQGSSDEGGISVYGIYTLPKSVQVNFLWSNNEVRKVIILN